MTVRSIPARSASATADASSLTPVLRTGVVSHLTPPVARGPLRDLRLLFDGRIRRRDGRIRQRDGRIRTVSVAFDGRIRGVLAPPRGRSCPAAAH